jgi:hypothetical protein
VLDVGDHGAVGADDLQLVDAQDAGRCKADLLRQLGDVLDRGPRRIEVDRYWDPRWKKVRVRDHRAYVNVRTFGPAIDALLDD